VKTTRTILLRGEGVKRRPGWGLTAEGLEPTAMWSSPTKKTVLIGRICYTKADGTVRVYDLTRNITIGRAAECDIRVKQATVSRVHCNIIRLPPPASPSEGGSSGPVDTDSPFVGDYHLENLSQTNLTEINYIAKWGKTQLKDGDIITIGERDFVFRLIKVQMSQEEITASQAPNTPKGKISLDDKDATPIPYPATGLGDNLCNPLWPGASSGAGAGDAPRVLSPAPVKATSAAEQSLWNCIPASIIPLGGGGSDLNNDAVDDLTGDDGGASTKFSAAGRVRFVNSVKAGADKKKKVEGARRQVEEIASKVQEGALDPNVKGKNTEGSWLSGLFFSV